MLHIEILFNKSGLSKTLTCPHLDEDELRTLLKTTEAVEIGEWTIFTQEMAAFRLFEATKLDLDVAVPLEVQHTTPNEAVNFFISKYSEYKITNMGRWKIGDEVMFDGKVCDTWG